MLEMQPRSVEQVCERFVLLRTECEQAIAKLSSEVAELAIKIARELSKPRPYAVTAWRHELATMHSQLLVERSILASLDDAEAIEVAHAAPVRAEWERAKRAADAKLKAFTERNLRAALTALRAMAVESRVSNHNPDWRLVNSATSDRLIDSSLRQEAVDLIAEATAAVPNAFYWQSPARQST